MIENAQGYESLPEARKKNIEEIKAAVLVTTVVENNFVPGTVHVFAEALKKRFPEANFKEIPEYQALIGGSEEPGDENDRELEREIVDEILNFVEELLEQKAKLRPIV